MKNFLEVDAAEFKHATKLFRSKRRTLGPALLCFEGDFLSIESGDATAVMRATGEWHGRATFSPEILRAVATVPPVQSPIMISYAEGHLLLGGMTIPCQWTIVSQAFIDDLRNPGLLDLLALERTIPRSEMGSSGLGKKIRGAQAKLARRIKNASAQLEELEVTETELRALVEAKIQSRLGMAIGPDPAMEMAALFVAFLEERIKKKKDERNQPSLPGHTRAIVKTEIAELEVIAGEFKRMYLK